MVGNTIKALLAAAVVVIFVAALAAYYLLHPQAAVTTIPVQAATTTILFNYGSFNSIGAQTVASMQHNNMSATYTIYANYPSYMQSDSRVINQETMEYNRSGNDSSIDLTVFSPVFNSSSKSLSMQFFDISGKKYFCSLPSGIGENTLNATCYDGGSTTPIFATLANRTYLTDRNGNMFGFMSQLVFSNLVVDTGARYLGYNTSYFHANLSSSSDAAIKGNVSIYTSSKYGVPLSYLILLNDPLYNSTNNTILVYLKATRISTNVSSQSMIPPYLAEFINSTSKK